MSQNIYSRTLGQLVKERLKKSTEGSDRDLRKYVVPVFHRERREKPRKIYVRIVRVPTKIRKQHSRTQVRCVMAWPNLHDKHDTWFSILLWEPRYYLSMISFKIFSRNFHSFIFKLSKKNKNDGRLLIQHLHRTATIIQIEQLQYNRSTTSYPFPPALQNILASALGGCGSPTLLLDNSISISSEARCSPKETNSGHAICLCLLTCSAPMFVPWLVRHRA